MTVGLAISDGLVSDPSNGDAAVEVGSNASTVLVRTGPAREAISLQRCRKSSLLLAVYPVFNGVHNRSKKDLPDSRMVHIQRPVPVCWRHSPA